VVYGDVNEPAALARALDAAGVPSDEALYVSKSVFHNRPYVAPVRPTGREPRSRAVFAAPNGDVIPTSLMEDNLVELFARWLPVARRHGMLMADAHCVAPEVSAANLGRTLMATLELTHCYSNQYLIEMPVYLEAAREAGFTVRSCRSLGAATLGHDYLSVAHFTG
jgi:hypothetical protein